LEPKRYFQESVFVRKKVFPSLSFSFFVVLLKCPSSICVEEKKDERVNNMLLMPNIVSLPFQLRGKKSVAKLLKKSIKVNREMVTTFFR